VLTIFLGEDPWMLLPSLLASRIIAEFVRIGIDLLGHELQKVAGRLLPHLSGQPGYRSKQSCTANPSRLCSGAFHRRMSSVDSSQ